MAATSIKTVLLLTLLFLPEPSLGNDIYDFSTESTVLRTASNRINGAKDRSNKDFVLGGLFPIHAAEEGGGNCGAIRLERGLERMEAMLFAIDMVNNDEMLLPGITLGYDIRDTCSSENIGLDETVDLVITNSGLDIGSCRSGSMSGINDTFSIVEPSTLGIIGAASSRVSVPVASLVRLFTTPQVSYASSSAILSNRDRYTYFYRTIPPDNLQARAMVDVMLYMNWTYISTIYSLNPYGEPGINELHMLAEQKGICVDLDEGIRDDYSDDDFENLAQKLIMSQANIVVLFTSQDNAEQLLGHIANSTTSRHFIWIASDAWARSINVVHQFNSTAAGLLGFTPLTEHLNSFEDYFSRLTLESNKRNPWFEEFYTGFVKCEVNGTGGSELQCNESSSVTEIPRYRQGNIIPLVVDAVYVYAHAIQDFLDENCDQPLTWFRNNRTCLGQSRPLTGSALLEYIQNVSFVSPTDNRIIFDLEGNVEKMYEILNYQVTTDDSGRREFGFERVATWDSSTVNDSNLQALSINTSRRIQFGVDNVTLSALYTSPPSQCGRCGVGMYRRIVQSACCGICEPCLGRNYSSDPLLLGCSICEGETWGNNPLVGSDGCVGLQESFLTINHPYSIIIMLISLLGLGAVLFTSVVFIIYRNTPVVKSSGREQMVLLLFGISLSFISAFFYVSPPHAVLCGIQRWLLWTCFSTMFGALLVKIIRVARIFLRKKNLSRPRFTEPGYQVLFTSILIFIQWIIIAISFAVDRPSVNRETRLIASMPDDFPTVVVTCVLENIVFLVISVAYETTLIIAGTILGGLSFSYPENFNEAKYVAFCSLSILVIWIAFIITYFATQSMQEFQNITISLAVVMTGYAVLLCLFGHKLFIMLFQPSRNVITLGHRTDDVNSAPLGTLNKVGEGGGGGGRRSDASPMPSLLIPTPTLDRKLLGRSFNISSATCHCELYMYGRTSHSWDRAKGLL